jgi:hypothetical protein
MESRWAPLERHSALLRGQHSALLRAQRSARLEPHSGPLERRHSAPDCCRAVRAAAAAHQRPQGVALPELLRLSAAVARPARRRARVSAERVRQRPVQLVSAERVRRQPVQLVSAERVRRRPGQLASAERVRRRPVQLASVERARQRPAQRVSVEQARQRVRPEVLAQQALQREARVASAQQAAALPPGGRDAAVVRRRAADAAGALPGAGAAPQPGAPRVLVAQVRGAAAVLRAWAVQDERAAVSAFRPDRLRSVPAPQPAVRFGRATTRLRIASP